MIGDIQFTKSFKLKIILPTVTVLVVLVISLNIFLSVRFSALGDALIREKLIVNVNSLNNFLESSRVSSQAAAVSMALNPNAIEAIKERDTSGLLRLFTSTHDLYGINYYTITDSEGVVLVRTHEPESFGDSILDQQNVIDALEGKVTSYFEEGSLVKISIRTGAPVYDADGVLVGVILAGVRFDANSTIDELKKLLNSEITLFLGNKRIISTVMRDGRSVENTILDPSIAEIVNGNGEYFGDANVLGEEYKTFYKPLLNAQNEVFATFSLGIPISELVTATNNSIRNGIVFGFIGLVASIILLSFILSSISKPIIKLSDDMSHIANGNLHINVSVNSEDEVGHLGKSLQRVVGILQTLLEDINIMIFEQEKGNIDYCLDTDKFLGEYKILAYNILMLSAFCIRDQLTGIPNRRSFDNRLCWEWNRAVREKEPISVLIIDVDKFKNYNDTHGHQQGDVALQTVAKSIKQSIKRSIDFAARWGGEEFVVLLPTTDAEGAISVAEKIRAAIENAKIPCADASGAKVTVSVGISTKIPMQDSSIENFIFTADTALYRAKEMGRNSVVLG